MSSIFEKFNLNSPFYSNHSVTHAFAMEDHLISYDPLKRITVVQKYKSSFAWINEIIKFFRNLFYPEIRISTVLEGLSVEAIKITTNQERLFYIRFINLLEGCD